MAWTSVDVGAVVVPTSAGRCCERAYRPSRIASPAGFGATRSCWRDRNRLSRNDASVLGPCRSLCREPTIAAVARPEDASANSLANACDAFGGTVNAPAATVVTGTHGATPASARRISRSINKPTPYPQRARHLLRQIAGNFDAPGAARSGRPRDYAQEGDADCGHTLGVSRATVCRVLAEKVEGTQ